MSKVVLITGGTRGIGLAIARQLAESDFNLAINGRRPSEDVREILGELTSKGTDVLYCQGDISNPDDRKTIVKMIKDHFGYLNLLVNNAGIAPRQRMDLLDTTEESFEKVLKVNLQGPYFLTQHIAQWMIDQKQADASFDAAIINISSVSARLASINRGEYCISKAGMSMMTKLFAVRLGASDIPVYEVQPGIIKTDMTTAVEAKYDKMLKEGLTLQKRWGLPEDVGKAVAALASGAFNYASGQKFVIDGGMTVGRL